MEGECASKALPEDLVEKIVAMVPFPSLFKARVLSKSWSSKFASISTSSLFQGGDDEERSLATLFQKQATMYASSWQTFCPLLVGKGNFIAFDRASHSWRTMPSLTYLPENLVRARAFLQMEGPFLYGFAGPEFRSGRKELYVTNILTKSWKQLPPRPRAGGSAVLCHKLVADTSAETYKVIVFCREDHQGMEDRYSAQIYDSNSDSWTRKRLEISSDCFKFSTAHLNGILYMVGNTNPRDLLAFNIKDGSLKEFPLSLKIDDKGVDSVNLVVCNSTLMMILTVYLCHTQKQVVLSIDLQSRSLVEMAWGPPDALQLGEMSTPPVSDGNYIYFGMEECSSSSSSNSRSVGRVRSTQVMAYNVAEDEWSCLPDPPSLNRTSNGYRRFKWSASAFRPGSSPFMAV